MSTENERTEYRVYPDGTVVHEDDFGENDNDNCIQPHDDYEQISIPNAIIDYIIECCS